METALANETRTETELSLAWARENPELFVKAFDEMQEARPDRDWTFRLDMSRKGFVTVTAIRRDSVIEFPATVEVEINWDHVANAMVSVVEGGYSPWFGRLDEDQTDETSVRLRAELIAAGKIWWCEGVYYDQGGKLVLCYDRPEDDEGTFEGKMTVGQAEFKAGFAKMAKEAPRHFGDFVAENGDAITDDVFVQMVLFGDIIYG